MTAETKIRVACPQCSTKFAVLARNVGAKAKCKKCGAGFVISEPAADSTVSSTGKTGADKSDDLKVERGNSESGKQAPPSPDATNSSQPPSPPAPPASKRKERSAEVLDDEVDDDDEEIAVFPTVGPPPSELAGEPQEEAAVFPSIEPPPPEAPASDSPPAALPERTSMRARRIKRSPWPAILMLGGLIIGGLGAGAVLLVMLSSDKTLTPPEHNLVIAWAEAERGGGSVIINGERQRLPVQGSVAYELPPGEHRVILQRRGFLPVDEKVIAEKETPVVITPVWDTIVAVPVESDLGYDPLASSDEPDRKVRVIRRAGFDNWEPELETAKEQAASEKKDLLIAFLDSDQRSRAFGEAVLSDEAFEAEASENYVLVLLDLALPFGSGIDQERKRNDQQFALNGGRTEEVIKGRSPPLLLAADASGLPYAAEETIESLADLQAFQESRAERDKLFAAVESAKGDEQLEAILAASNWVNQTQLFAQYTDQFNRWYELAQEIDPKNERQFLERAFADYWLSRYYQATAIDRDRYVRLLFDLNQWRKDHSFKNRNAAGAVLLTAADVMLELKNPKAAAEYLKGLEEDPPSAEVLREDLAELLYKVENALKRDET